MEEMKQKNANVAILAEVHVRLLSDLAETKKMTEETGEDMRSQVN